jgi:osmotically-inducible protein OsmY
MSVEQSTQTTLEAPNLYRSLTWDQNRDVKANDPVSVDHEALKTRFIELIRVDQKVFLTGNQSIGKITKLLPDSENRISYLVIRTARFWGHYKILPVGFVRDVNAEGVWLSINRNEFQKLPDYKTDASITAEVVNALWNDKILRVIDFDEIDVRVKDGVVFLNGHISGMTNQERIKKAIESVKGVLGVKNHLIPDDNLLLAVAKALTQIERLEGNRVYAKVQSGVVTLSGKVVSAKIYDFAGQYAANVPQVRAVINNIAAPGIDPNAVDQNFVQPGIGETIYFRDGLFGLVKHVIINRNNRRVTGMIIQGQFPDRQPKPKSIRVGGSPTSKRLAVIPVSVIRYLTGDSGFLYIDSTETNKYQDFTPQNFVTPEADWVPPYPYCADNVMFLSSNKKEIH